jgi:small ligand-binding sensory domain FIST
MAWASGLSERIDAREAAKEAVAAARDALGGPPDLALVFTSSLHAPSYAAVASALGELLPDQQIAGCSALGVIGGGREVERREALSVMLANLPGVRTKVFHLEALPRDDAAWERLTGVPPAEHDGASFLLFADPFSTDVDALLARFDAAYPRATKLGGVASGAARAGDSALFYGSRLLRDGVVGVALSRPIQVDAVVAQGCRPIGETMIITRCRESVIQELNVGKPMEALQRTFKGLSPRDQELGRHSLYVGIEMRSGAHRYDQGDFLVREVAGFDPKTGAMAISGKCQDYQAVQFHLRDAQTSAQDLERRLIEARRALGDGRVNGANGALLFSCLGRGQALYGSSNHDSDVIRRLLGPIPIAGFFGAGEIGPVGGRTFLHGYTSSIALLTEAAG